MFIFPLLLSRMWGELVISVPLYFLQCSPARPKPSSPLAEMDAEQRPHRSAKHSALSLQVLPTQISISWVRKHILSVETMQQTRAEAPTCSQLTEVGGNTEGEQVMSAQHFSPGFGRVYRDTLHYSSIPGSNQCFVITGISLLIEG